MRYLLHAYEYTIICAFLAAAVFLGIGVLFVRPEKWQQAILLIGVFGCMLAAWVFQFPGFRAYDQARRNDLLGIWWGRLLAFPYVLPPFLVVMVLTNGWPKFH